MSIRKKRAAIVVLSLGLMGLAAPRSDQEAISAVMDTLEALDTLRMTISYTSRDEAHDIKLVAEVVMADGGRVALRLREGDEEIAGLIADGSNVVEWDRRKRRWTRYVDRELSTDRRGRLWKGGGWETNRHVGNLMMWCSASWVTAPSPYEWVFQRVRLADEYSWKRQTLNGRECDSFTCRQVQRQGPITVTQVVRLVYDATTHLPVLEESDTRTEATPPLQVTGNWFWRCEYQHIDTKGPLDEGAFAYRPPADFTFVAPRELERPPAPLIGKSASDWQVQSLDGKTIAVGNEAQTGGLVLVAWATWCLPCKAELKALADMRDQGTLPQAVKVVAVNVEKNREHVRTFLESSPLPFPVAHDPEFLRRLGLTGVPTTVIIDEKGIVRATLTGWSDGTDDAMESRLRDALRSLGK